ncbi:hypothetical protein EHF33_14760 [Deinococcus psychrotolerans]|uniref:Uncharacterized protein n=2 Tax=Deinococcus psychrotolerans TaxID=2489213 RepID=A0A3G8YGK6_9DEIO|nr:hypothetical protein EHF33_14760 [Deinococcus psychrotolerans]
MMNPEKDEHWLTSFERRLAGLGKLDSVIGASALLAPVGTSFDQFHDCAQRGDSFRRAVLALIGAAEVKA